ncbi:hypothetical protein [Methylomonas sp. ZR1]|uniref:hypothetical protein n=1 Tax=Methylomonas sp. ZR1 TaxID=1797072 RepID=UPI0014911D64|nr:hypothetical protein [Methylomonas sp. ZR1]
MAADKTPGDLHQIQPKSGCFAPGWLNWRVHTDGCVHEAQHSTNLWGVIAQNPTIAQNYAN